MKSKRFFSDTYSQDLKRYGTPQGIIDVANDDGKKKKPFFPIDISKSLLEGLQGKHKKRVPAPNSQNPFADVYRDFPKTQITISNSSAEQKQVQLWGSSPMRIEGPALPTQVERHLVLQSLSIPGGIHPQGMVVNPANNFVYVANQLSGTVTVINTNNQVVKVIQLEPVFAGLTSPVALTVNSSLGRTKYGFVYVACSVANKVAEINLSLNVTGYLSVGVRPVAIAFNPVNGCLYAANLVSNSLSVISSDTFLEVQSSPLNTGSNPIGLGINPLNGDVYVTNSLGNSVSVFSSLNVLITTVPNLGDYPVSATYNPANNLMYVTATNSNKVFLLNTQTYTVLRNFDTGSKPYNSFFNSYNNFLYVQNRQDNTFTVLRPDHTKVDALSFGEQNIGGVFNPANQFIYVSDTSANAINVIGYNEGNSSLSFSADYNEVNEDFKSNPCIIQHVRFVVNGDERLNSFRVNHSTATGSNRSKTISFELYASPQARLNVAEVLELSGTVIDGKMNWSFNLPGHHTVSILVWYRQLQMRSLLNSWKGTEGTTGTKGIEGTVGTGGTKGSKGTEGTKWRQEPRLRTSDFRPMT